MDGLNFHNVTAHVGSYNISGCKLDGEVIGTHEWVAPRELQPRFKSLEEILDALKVGIYGKVRDH